MAKFCGNCGASVDDDALVCGYCGASMANSEAGSASKKIPGVGDIDPEKAKKIKAIAKKVVIGVAAVAVVAIIISVVLKFVGINGAIRNYVKAYQKGDASYIEKLESSYLDKGDEDEEDDDDEEDSLEQKALDSVLEYFEDEVDSADFKITYEVKKKEDLSERKVKKLAEALVHAGIVSEDDEDTIKESKIKVVKIKMTAKHKKKKEKKTFDNLYFIKEGGSWKLLYDGGYDLTD